MGRLYYVTDELPTGLKNAILAELEGLAARQGDRIDHLRLQVRRTFMRRFSLEAQIVLWDRTLVERAESRSADGLHRDWCERVLPRLSRRLAS